MLMALCALAACGNGGGGSPAAAQLFYNGLRPFPAVVGEAIALTPAMSGKANLYTAQRCGDFRGERHWRGSSRQFSASTQRDRAAAWPLLRQPGQRDRRCSTCTAEAEHCRKR